MAARFSTGGSEIRPYHTPRRLLPACDFCALACKLTVLNIYFRYGIATVAECKSSRKIYAFFGS
jgi:hypothetical protein